MTVINNVMTPESNQLNSSRGNKNNISDRMGLLLGCWPNAELRRRQLTLFLQHHSSSGSTRLRGRWQTQQALLKHGLIAESIRE